MKNFEKITSDEQALASVVVNIAQGTARDTIQTIRNSLEEHDFSVPQYRYLMYLLAMIEARNDLQRDGALQMYIDWLRQEETLPTGNEDLEGPETAENGTATTEENHLGSSD